jgi:hypothetical protein
MPDRTNCILLISVVCCQCGDQVHRASHKAVSSVWSAIFSPTLPSALPALFDKIHCIRGLLAWDAEHWQSLATMPVLLKDGCCLESVAAHLAPQPDGRTMRVLIPCPFLLCYVNPESAAFIAIGASSTTQTGRAAFNVG